MILVFSQRFAPVECGGQGEEIPTGLPCPGCRSKPGSCLWKHGYYLRIFISIGESETKIKITRLRCPLCNKTYSCLFPCLVPHSSYSTDSLGKLVTPYFFEDKSCAQIGWEASDGEGEGHRHLVHSLVERLCEQLDWITSFVEKQTQRQGESLWRRKEPEPEAECSNARRVKSKEKKAALTRVKAVLMKFKENSEHRIENLVCVLHRAGLQLRAPFSLLTRAKVMFVKTTHDWGNTLL